MRRPPFCHLALLDTLTDGNAIFSVTDARTLPQGSPAVAAIGRVKVSHDLSGDVFVDALLAQEIRKHPPTRSAPTVYSPAEKTGGGCRASSLPSSTRLRSGSCRHAPVLTTPS